MRLADYRGKTLVVNVWGSWCPPCRLETADLILEAKGQAARGVAFLGVDTTESAAVVRAFVAAKGILTRKSPRRPMETSRGRTKSATIQTPS